MWTRHGRFFGLDNLSADDSRVSHTQLPVVDTHHPDYWRMYYSSRDAKGFSLPYSVDIEPGNPQCILGQQNLPLLATGQGGSFDQHGVMPTAVLHHEGQVYLYYIGWSRQSDVPYRNTVGLAISDDGGRSFEKWPGNPLFPHDTIDPVFTGTLTVVPAAGGFHGYYMSCSEWRLCEGKLEPRYRLKYASSTDGTNWQREGHIVIDYLDDEEGGIVAASVIQHRNHYHMWYCYRRDRDYRDNPDSSYRIGYAQSVNAIDWQRRDDLGGLDVSEQGWDSVMTAYPCVVTDQQRCLLFYNGNGFGQSGIGYASCPLGQLP